MTREPFRLPPKLEPADMKTYEILAPAATHWRPAACEDVQCDAFMKGWRTIVDETTDLGKGQAYYIRKSSGRKFQESRDAAGLTVFEFSAFQRCFRQHKERTDKPELFIVREGDYRGNPRGTRARQHARPADWVDDFAGHQQALHDRLDRG